jgi:hypothetical protein
VLDDHPVDDPPDVDERPRSSSACGGHVREQRHRRGSVGAVQGEVLGHGVAVADEVVLFEGDRTQVVVDGAQDLRETPAALRPGRVVDHVVGDQVVEHEIPARLLATEQFLDHLACAPTTHGDSIPPVDESRARPRSVLA